MADDADRAQEANDAELAAQIQAARTPQPMRRCEICTQLYTLDQLAQIGKLIICENCTAEMELKGRLHGKGCA